MGESSSTVPWLLVATLLGHTPAPHERHDELPHQLLRLPWLMHPLQPGNNVNWDCVRMSMSGWAGCGEQRGCYLGGYLGRRV